MNRRHLLAALACWPAGRVLAQDDAQRPRQKISAATLMGTLSQRFPVRLQAQGLFMLQLDAKALLLLPARQRLGATLGAQLSGPQLQRAGAGELDAVFALRYEPGDRSVRAHSPELLGLRWPGLPPDTALALQALLPGLARDALGEVVLHRFTERELALPDTMGFEPQQLTVADDGLVIGFGPKPRN